MENYSCAEQTVHNKPSITPHYKANVATTLLSALSIKVDDVRRMLASASYPRGKVHSLYSQHSKKIPSLSLTVIEFWLLPSNAHFTRPSPSKYLAGILVFSNESSSLAIAQEANGSIEQVANRKHFNET